MEIRCADHVTPLYPQKLALTSPTGGGRSVGIVRSRTRATEFSFLVPLTLSAAWLPSQDLYHNYLVSNLFPTEHRTMQQKCCALCGTISRLSKAVMSHYIPLRISMSRLRTTRYSSLSSLPARSYSPPSNWQLKSQVEHFQRVRTFNWNFQHVDAVGTLQVCFGT